MKKRFHSKRFLSIFLALVMMTGLLPISTLTAFAEGESYWTDPGNYDISWYDPNGFSFTISTAKQLAGVAVLVNGMNGETATDFTHPQFTGMAQTIILSADIDLSGKLWTPIGATIGDVKHTFKGSITGQNYSISNMKVNAFEIKEAGLIGNLGGSAQVRDLAVTDVQILCDSTKTDNVNWYSGGIAATVGGSAMIMNCRTSGKVQAEFTAGGIVGDTSGSARVQKCYNEAEVVAIGWASDETRNQSNAGGIAGTINGGTVTNCYNLGAVKSEADANDQSGGITAKLGMGSLSNAYNRGTVTGTGNYVGSITAYVNPPSTYGTSLTNCYYLSATASAGIYSAVAALKTNAVEKSSAAFASGEVAYLLNGSVDGGTTWCQNLDNGNTKDSYPVFSGGKVNRVTTYTKCDMSDTEPVVSYSNINSGNVVPVHQYQYSATDNVITETCKNCNTHTKTATLVVDPSADLTYTGSEHEPVKVDYSNNWQGGTLTVGYEENIKVGQNTAKAYVEKENARAEITFTIAKATNTWDEEPTISDWIYGGVASAPNMGDAKFGTVRVKYTGTANDQTPWDSTDAPTLAGEYKAIFTVEGTTDYTTLNKEVTFKIKKATYDMSKAKWNYTDAFQYDGYEKKVEVTDLPTGVTVSAYKNNTGTLVDDYTASVTLSYDNYNYEEPAKIADLPWSITSWMPVEGVDYTIPAPNENGWYNEEFRVKGDQDKGLFIMEENKYNSLYFHELATQKEGETEFTFYVRRDSDGAISLPVTVQYKLDKNTELTATAGKVEFVERKAWQEFVSTITFGLFYKDEVTVKITANDALSGVDKIEYASSDEAMTLAEVKAITDWTEYTDSFGVTYEEAKKFVYFVRITDKAGNMTYLSSDGAEYDNTDPVISGVEDGETYYTTQKVTVTDKNLDTVTLNGGAATSEIILGGNVNTATTYTIVAKDKAGNENTYTVNMKPIRELSEPIDDIDKTNVNSGDEQAVDKVKSDVAAVDTANATEEEKAALKEIADKATELEQVIDDTKAEIDRITEELAKYDDATVNSDDTEALEQLGKDIKALTDGDNLTDEQRTGLTEDAKEKTEDLIDVIKDAKAATETENIEKVKDVTAENVTPQEKTDLEKAKEDLEKVLEDYSGNYTGDEKKAVEDELRRIDDALAVIGNAEAAEDKIRKLPDTVTKQDEEAIQAAEEAYNALTDYERSLVAKDVKQKLDAAKEALAALIRSTSPDTGDNTALLLWIALLFVSGGVFTTLTVADRKKKTVKR